jgi:hypothetical protein
MKTWRRAGIASQIFNCDTKCRFVVVVVCHLFCPHYLLERGLVGSKYWPGFEGK